MTISAKLMLWPETNYGITPKKTFKICISCSNLIKENGLDSLPIFAEVSVQQSSQSGYNPETTAKFCFQALDKARNEIDS